MTTSTWQNSKSRWQARRPKTTNMIVLVIANNQTSIRCRHSPSSISLSKPPIICCRVTPTTKVLSISRSTHIKTILKSKGNFKTETFWNKTFKLKTSINCSLVIQKAILMLTQMITNLSLLLTTKCHKYRICSRTMKLNKNWTFKKKQKSQYWFQLSLKKTNLRRMKKLIR